MKLLLCPTVGVSEKDILELEVFKINSEV